MKNIFLFIAILSLVGCATVKITPPVDNKIERTRTVNKDFEATWIKAVDWFAEHNVTIDKIEKSSGLITAKYLLKADSKHLDCGEIETSGFLGEPIIHRNGMLNLTVREISKRTTRATVNFFGRFTLEGRDSWDSRIVTAEGNCISTGILEDSILDYMYEDGLYLTVR